MKETVRKGAKISRRHLDSLLSGDRNAGPKTARRLERVTGIAKEIWVFGDTEQRQIAWSKFVQKIE